MFVVHLYLKAENVTIFWEFLRFLIQFIVNVTIAASHIVDVTIFWEFLHHRHGHGQDPDHHLDHPNPHRDESLVDHRDPGGHHGLHPVYGGWTA